MTEKIKQELTNLFNLKFDEYINLEDSDRNIGKYYNIFFQNYSSISSKFTYLTINQKKDLKYQQIAVNQALDFFNVHFLSDLGENNE